MKRRWVLRRDGKKSGRPVHKTDNATIAGRLRRFVLDKLNGEQTVRWIERLPDDPHPAGDPSESIRSRMARDAARACRTKSEPFGCRRERNRCLIPD